MRFYDLTIRGGHILQFGDGGGGIRIEQGSVYLYRCNVVDNRTGSWASGPTYSGGGIKTTDSGYVSITDTTIADNWAGHYGGGVANTGASTLFMARSTVTGNEDGAWGGAGVYNQDTMQIVNSTISGNMGSGIIGGLWNVGDLTVESCTVTGNSGKSSTQLPVVV